MARATVIVVAAETDGEAHALPVRLPDLDVRLLTPADLSCAGWEFRPGCTAGMAVASGSPVATQDIAAVLVRLPWVREHDVLRVDAADRAYAAAEMSAFLLAWLSALPCPVINRPSSSCLAGPLWRPQRWAVAAASVGLRVAPVRCTTGATDPRAPAADAPTVIATVIGERCLGVEEPALAVRLCKLARMAGAEALTIGLSDATADARFVTASPWPDLADDLVLDAVLARAGITARVARAAVRA